MEGEYHGSPTRPMDTDHPRYPIGAYDVAETLISGDEAG